MKITVLSVAYPFAPAGPDAVGGAEQVLAMLDAALARGGHRSIVIACQGSKVKGTLLSTPKVAGAIDEQVRQLAHERHRAAIAEALERWPIDLVHMHGIDFDRYLPPPGVPVLVTLHLPPSWYAPEVFRLERPDLYLHCVSASQRRASPSAPRLLPEVIENGVPIDQLATRVRRRNFAVALGRICPEKGFHIAIEAAARARVPLILAGAVFRYQAHERYFQQEIVPRLGSSCRFIGPVGLARKRRLLAAARCLLVPSLAPESSSLVAMEALACGTPVIALPAGALAEIVEHGKTGYLVRDAREMAEAMAATGSIDPEACRSAARERFSAERMAACYLELYRRILADVKHIWSEYPDELSYERISEAPA